MNAVLSRLALALFAHVVGRAERELVATPAPVCHDCRSARYYDWPCAD